MKIKTIIFGLLLLTPFYTHAQIRVYQGGTGLSSVGSGLCLKGGSDNFTLTTGACGSGSGGGTWSTTTSNVSGQFINYPNNTTDIVTVGGTATTSAKYFFDPNTTTSYLSSKVGINTKTPAYPLDVAGIVNISPFSAYYQDATMILYASSTDNDTIVGQAGATIYPNDPSGGEHTALGYHALNALTAGSSLNTCVGAFCGTDMTSGYHNTGVGDHSMRNTTTGLENTFAGYGAGYQSNGNDNVGFGNSTLYHSTGGFNVALGQLSGFTNIVGSNNVFIGREAGYFTNASSSIIIGAYVDSPLTSTNSILNIGNVLYGSGMYNAVFDGAVSSVPTSNGRIAIGTSTPNANLTVWGNSNTGRILEVANSASTTLLWVSSTGNGTTTLAGLNVSASATSTSNVGFNLTAGCFSINNTCVGGGGASVTGGTAGMLTSWVNGTTLTATSGPTASYYTATSSTATSTFAGDVIVGTGTATLTLDYSGFLGLGTTSPFALLSLKPATTTIPFVISTTTVKFASSTLFEIDSAGTVITGGGAPSVSCASTCGLDAHSNDQHGTINISGVQTAVTLTFYSTKPWNPVCVSSDSSAAGQYEPTSVSTTAVTFSVTASIGTGVIYYICEN